MSRRDDADWALSAYGEIKALSAAFCTTQLTTTAEDTTAREAEGAQKLGIAELKYRFVGLRPVSY